ncbi:site-specific integrase [Dietzia timorensis]|uniref:Uncharacterized protein n=1 Tax=Dietzia timorensis TaxID=499555 RepID=A0A173LHV5_9ACTN|nr:site-specific integrase [Dietzia timorensis]ANI91359.1 Hypothetical protein BJL86_0556 [Dietzia timorensis]
MNNLPGIFDSLEHGKSDGRIFDPDDEVFAQYPGKVEDASVVRYSDISWSLEGVADLRRNSHFGSATLKFRAHEPWLTLMREFAMVQLNPSDRRVLSREIYIGLHPVNFSTVISKNASLQLLASWQRDCGLPTSMCDWTAWDWENLVMDLVESGRAKGTIKNLVSAVRDLISCRGINPTLIPKLDPWDGAPTAKIAQRAEAKSMKVIEPAVWMPLMAAAWKYISVFSADIISLRTSHDCREAVDRSSHKTPRQLREEVFRRFLDSYQGPIPARIDSGEIQPAWVRLSILVTCGASTHHFAWRNVDRRDLIRSRVSSGALQLEVMTKTEFENLCAEWNKVLGAPELDSAKKSGEETNKMVRDWLSLEDSRVALKHRVSDLDSITSSDINWAMMEREVYNANCQNGLLSQDSENAQFRRQLIVDFARKGRVYVADKGQLSRKRKCPGFVQVESSSGELSAWATELSDFEARNELLALRAACFIFVCGMTLMRDSEIQAIRRNSIIDYFGQRAVRSVFYKGRTVPTPGFWWVTDEVVQAFEVLESLSMDEEYLVGAVVKTDIEKGPKGSHKAERKEFANRGITAGREIDRFISIVNRCGSSKGLSPIPSEAGVGPRSLRRTGATILRELGADELSLSRQLKHSIAATRSSVTASYMAPDRNWEALLRGEQRQTAIHAVSNALASNDRKKIRISGGGANRIQEAAEALGLSAETLTSREVQALLKTEEGELFMGATNACLYDPSTALCHKRGEHSERPHFASCDAVNCRNSVITIEQLPIWKAERSQLKTLLEVSRVSSVRKKMLERRLQQVEKVISDFVEE